MYVSNKNKNSFLLDKSLLIIWEQVHVHGKVCSDQRMFKVFRSLATLETGSSK